MGMMMWNPAWETGIRSIDLQHRELLNQIEALMAAIHLNEAEASVPGLLDFLASYVDRHFQEEEAAMAASSYPGLDAHRLVHDQMRRDVSELLRRFEADSSAITDEVLDFLTNWLINHINGEDRQMAQHLLRWAPAHAKGRP